MESILTENTEARSDPMVAAIDIIEKNDRRPVTVADFASQAIVCTALVDNSSVRSVVAEESAEQLRSPQAAGQRDTVLKLLRAARGSSVSLQQVYEWIDLGASPLRRGGGCGPRYGWRLTLERYIAKRQRSSNSHA